MTVWDMRQAAKLKDIGSKLSREDMSKAVISAIDDFDGSYKDAMVLAGRLKAICQAAKSDCYWSEKVDDGYLHQMAILEREAASVEDRNRRHSPSDIELEHKAREGMAP